MADYTSQEQLQARPFPRHPKRHLRERGTDQYRVELDGEDAAWLRDVRGVRVDDVDGSTALLTLDGTTPAELVRTVSARSGVLEVARVRQPLSEIFREVTR